MMNSNSRIPLIENIYLRWAAIVTIFIMTLTGFGQMPIFKRYYIADIPGFAWTGDYYITHVMHYTGAIILLAIAAYIIANYLTGKRETFAVTKNGLVKIVIFLVLILTGVLKVISSQKGVYFGQTVLVSLDIIHTAFTFIMLISFAASGIMKTGWFRERG